MENEPFWAVVPTPRSEHERLLLQCILRQKLRDNAMDLPDCWMHKDRSRFSSAFIAGQFDIPMYPCRTVMSTPHFNDTIDHHQLYVGNGMYVRMFQFRSVQLGFLPSERSELSRKLFRVVSHPKAEPEQVMRRVIASLGNFSWSPRHANCHSVTTWQLFGQGDRESLIANDVSQLYSLTWLLWLSLFILSVLLVIKGFYDCAKIHRLKS